VATLIVYLNTVEEGGETVFPKLNLKFKPVQGDALYFAYADTNNELDRMTLHGGAPVLQGNKWIMTKWMRQEKFE
jgi:prolyl 4-hydroxylase